jgi:hypothetical protein
MGVVFFHFLDFIGCLSNGLRLAGLLVIGFFVDWVCRLLQTLDWLTQAAWVSFVKTNSL